MMRIEHIVCRLCGTRRTARINSPQREAFYMTDFPNADNTLMMEAFHEMMRGSRDYFFIKDADLVYRGGSDSFLRLMGLKSLKELNGKTDDDFFSRELAERYRADDRAVMESGQTLEGNLEQAVDQDGQVRWLETWKHPIRTQDGVTVGVYGVSCDMTESVRAEEKAKSARRDAMLIQNLPGGVGIVHEKGGQFWLDFANDGWAQTHHISRDDRKTRIGTNITDLIYEPDRQRVRQEYQKAEGQADRQGSLLYRICGGDGRLHWVSIQFCFAYEEHGVHYYYVSYMDMDEQMDNKEKLEDSRRALMEAVENSNIQFFTYLPGKHRCEIYAVNRRLSELPQKWENFPQDFFDYMRLSPEDARLCREMFEKIDRGADSAECTIKLLYKGVPAWEHICVRAQRDETGRSVKGLGYSVNVSARKRAEELLEKQRMRLRAMESSAIETVSYNVTQNSALEILTTDQELLYGPVNAGIEREALRVYPPIADIHEEARRFLLRAAERIPEQEQRALFLRICGGETAREALRDGRASAEIRYRRRVGQTVRWVVTRAEILPEPETRDMLAFLYTKDINDAVINEEMNRRIVDMNYVSVAFCDLQSGRLFMKSTKEPMNPQLTDIPYDEALRIGAEKSVEKSEAAAFAESLALSRILAELKRVPVYTFYYTKPESRGDLPGNPHRQMKADMFYLDEHQDVLVFLLTEVTEIFQRDLENRERMSAALTAAKQASMAKSNFLSRMSHEIRTPLNAIIGMDAIAAQSVENPERVADCVSKIGISARYLLSLINDILDMSRIESGKMLLKNEKFLFRDFISGINNMIYNQATGKGLDFECTVNSELAEAYIGDPMKLQQVLINILGNAVKFTEKGKISLDIHPVSHKGAQSLVRFTVNDTGVGIREDFLQKIFEPFEQSDTSTTTSFGGTGLGLAITKNLVTLMGGTIHVRSIVGVGSEFTVEVPMTVDESVLVTPKLELHFEKMHTLIVDDDLIVCEQTESILESMGMCGEWVTSGAEAISRVKQESEKSAFYDFILVDWKMPDMDGLETTRQIRKVVGPDVTIIIVTAYDWESIEIEAKAAGANLLISKPLLRSTLVSAFQKARGLAEAESPKETAFDFTGRRVLVAEDNQINAEIAKCLLENKNFTVELAPNGQKALELYAQNPDYYYDAILMDIRMPLMDGLQTTTNIRHWNRADAKTIPIIAMTANAFDEDVDKSKAAGMNAHLSKPIDPNLLYGTLHRIFTEEN